MLKKLQPDQPETIRLAILCAEPDRKQALGEYFSHPDRFPLHLIETITSLQESRIVIKQTQPHVVLLVDEAESQGWTEGVLQLSKELNLEHRQTTTVLLASTVKVDERYLRSAMNAGVRDVVKTERIGVGKTAPILHEVETAILHAYRFIRHQIAANATMQRPAGAQTLTLFSGRGGVGKSMLSSAVAGEIARQKPNKKVALLDLDAQFGSIGAMLGLPSSAKTVAQILSSNLPSNPAIRAEEFLNAVSVGSNTVLYVAPSPPSTAELRSLSWDDTSAILSFLRRSFDYVVVDLPAQIMDSSLAAFQASDFLLFVCTPELLSVRATSQMLQVVESGQLQISATTRSKVVINKIGENNLVKLADVEGFFADKVAARFPFDPLYITEQINSGLPIGNWTPNKQIGQKFLGELKTLCAALGITNDVPTQSPAKKSEHLFGLF